MKQLETYTYTIPAGGSIQIPAPNDNFYVNASTGPLSVRGDTFGRLRGLVAGQGLKGVPFNRLELIDESGAPNTVTILLTPAEFVNQVFSGSVAVVGALSLDTATINALARPFGATGNYKQSTTLASNTPDTVFTPAANTNGAIVLTAYINHRHTTLPVLTFLAKASAPADSLDGEVLLQAGYTGSDVSGATGYGHYGALDVPQFIPAGLGVYFVAGGGFTAGNSNARSCRYRLL